MRHGELIPITAEARRMFRPGVWSPDIGDKPDDEPDEDKPDEDIEEGIDAPAAERPAKKTSSS